MEEEFYQYSKTGNIIIELDEFIKEYPDSDEGYLLKRAESIYCFNIPEKKVSESFYLRFKKANAIRKGTKNQYKIDNKTYGI